MRITLSDVAVFRAVHQVSGFLILNIECPHIQPLGRAVMEFSDMDELKDRLISVIEEKPIVNETLKLAEEYVSWNSKEKVSQQYMKLIERLIATSGS